MKEKVYAEIGLGNKTSLSTEYEKGKKEHRVNGFLKPKKILWYIVRIWIGKKVYILSRYSGFKVRSKDENKIKILFGIGGYNK